MRQIDLTEDAVVEGRTIRVADEVFAATYHLPVRAQMVTMMKLSDGLARLTMGTFSRTHVAITGPEEMIELLRKEVG